MTFAPRFFVPFTPFLEIVKKTFLTLLLGGLCLAAAFGAISLMTRFKPEVAVVEKPRLLPAVDVIIARASDVTLQLPSQGMVEPVRTTTLAAEVPGRVVEVSPEFEVGERFQKGDLLVRIEDADYQAALVQAQANLEEAKASLVSEKARAEQGEREWKQLGTNQPPSDLVLRKPQLASAEARVAAAEGAVAKARRDLERTRITAPFAGRLRLKQTEVGSYLNPGAPVAELASTGTYRVRLPLPVEDLAFLAPAEASATQTPVTLTAESSGQKRRWSGTLLRTEGEVERASRSVYLVAQVDETGSQDLLQPGLFVQAGIQGRQLKGVYRVPRSVFLDQDRLILVDAQNRLRFQRVTLIRPDGTDLLVSKGIQDGDRICSTALSSPVEGMEVRPLTTPASPAPPSEPTAAAGSPAP